MPEPHQAVLRPHIRERAVRAGETIEREGEHWPVLGVVKVGLFKGSRTHPGGSDKAIVLLGRGRLVGFAGMFRNRSQLTNVALTSMRICEVEVGRAIDLALPHEAFRQVLIGTVARFVDSVADWSRIQREDSFVSRLHLALRMIAAEEGSASIRMPGHADLADLLGARRETIGRHIGTLAQQGLLQRVDRWHVVLKG